MGLKTKLSTDIRQNADSCLMISFNVIFNYYTNLESNYLFDYFLLENDHLYATYNIDKIPTIGLSPECKYVYLYRSLVKATNGNVQFNNEYISESFKKLTNQYSVATRIVDIKKEVDLIKKTLIENEACLSLTIHGSWGAHVTPIGYDTEFYTVHNGLIISFGQDFMNIKSYFQANDIGDGILFEKNNMD